MPKTENVSRYIGLTRTYRNGTVRVNVWAYAVGVYHGNDAYIVSWYHNPRIAIVSFHPDNNGLEETIGVYESGYAAINAVFAHIDQAESERSHGGRV